MPIFIVFMMFPNSGLADGKDELVKRASDFKKAFSDRLYGTHSWGAQFDGSTMIQIAETIVVDHGIQGDLIPFIIPLSEEYSAKGDSLSLIILAAMCLNYVPHASREIILSYLMILQSAVFEAMKYHAIQKEYIFNLIEKKFEDMPSDGINFFIKESQTVFNSVSLDYYSTFFRPSEQVIFLSYLSCPLTLLAALSSTWAIYPSERE